jgi:hypothetical protein
MLKQLEALAATGQPGQATSTTRRPEQLDLFAPEPTRQARQIIGRVKLFPKPEKQPEPSEPAPFDDDISDIGF